MRELMAILRGLTPEEAPAVGEALVEAGIQRLEVPLNSPRPFESIALLAERLGGRAEVGAGTVLTPGEVRKVRAARGRFVVSPNTDRVIIEATRDAGLDSYPGAFTATECLVAAAAGATALKLFPAFLLGPAGVAALKAVMPPALALYAVGGIDAPDLSAYRRAGCIGFGLGSNLYKLGRAAGEVGAAARRLVEAYDALNEKKPEGRDR
ncbi:2-keto-3-deoxy-phosphogalactonate aldolase [Tistlia consotensis]|uniref:2-keto-3-deoxy-phosphogalactonate aldolase n=1 Tax=Tistlia consotensis USBA 355 TaxID=560819 RepID=A0A1Y6BJP1_9PROT|nr:2-dehydro-3-deoxy-6-phosphogalactonate aldolase [Tistlia consotensis]SMF13148.1 2-keto-3-deoxy-phosphogalactonate aldolase [Tistlia consotensis USBA 355]SNR50689.1 2-keto-3-deoxy-phosphogalactonate aldolase [Tistlia consotensis]